MAATRRSSLLVVVVVLLLVLVLVLVLVVLLPMLMLLVLVLLLLLLLLAAERLPPHGVVRFLCWHVLKLEFWHFAHPQLNLRFVFASCFFAVFYATAGGLHCTKKS